MTLAQSRNQFLNPVDLRPGYHPYTMVITPWKMETGDVLGDISAQCAQSALLAY